MQALVLLGIWLFTSFCFRVSFTHFYLSFLGIPLDRHHLLHLNTLVSLNVLHRSSQHDRTFSENFCHSCQSVFLLHCILLENTYYWLLTLEFYRIFHKNFMITVFTLLLSFFWNVQVSLLYSTVPVVESTVLYSAISALFLTLLLLIMVPTLLIILLPSCIHLDIPPSIFPSAVNSCTVMLHTVFSPILTNEFFFIQVHLEAHTLRANIYMLNILWKSSTISALTTSSSVNVIPRTFIDPRSTPSSSKKGILSHVSMYISNNQEDRMLNCPISCLIPKKSLSCPFTYILAFT